MLGAVTVTAGLALFIYTVSQTQSEGWGSARTLAGFAVSLALIAAFLVREATARSPLIRLGIFRNRTLSSANVVGLMTGGSLFAMFFFISLYLQRVLGYSPLETGIAYLPLAVSIFLSAGVASALVQRLGVRPVLVTGLTLTTVGPAAVRAGRRRRVVRRRRPGAVADRRRSASGSRSSRRRSPRPTACAATRRASRPG